MPYHHLAHLDSFDKHIKLGVKVRRGDPIGKVGKSGTQYAHLHFEVMRIKPDYWTQYVYTSSGPMTKEQVKQRYIDPAKWIDKSAKIPAPFTTYGGYEFLDPINKAGTAWHPGVDINDGYGDQDLGNPVRSPCNGEIVYLGKNDGGWGNHLWLYEDDTNQYPYADWGLAKRLAGKILIAVEDNGSLWYVDSEGVRHDLSGTPEETQVKVAALALGITNADLNKIVKG